MWERQLDAPFRRDVRRRHLRVAIGAALGVGLWAVWVIFAPWGANTSLAFLWGSVLAGATAMNAYYAVRMWNGDADPEPLPPGPHEPGEA